MKLLGILIFTILLVNSTFAQLKKLDQFEHTYLKKAEVGMTADEVKKVLGRPRAIEGGFPEISGRILATVPNQAGQLNNSTWFYWYDNISYVYDYQGGKRYYVNDRPVTEELFIEYKDREKVFLYKDEVIDTSIAKEYLFLKDPNLIVAYRDYRTEMREEKSKKITQKLKPILCVIFDKGTQVVADTRIYFLIVDIK